MRKKNMSGWSIPNLGIEAKDMTGFNNNLCAFLQRYSYKFKNEINGITITFQKDHEYGKIKKETLKVTII